MAIQIRSYEIPLIDSLKPALNLSIQDIKDPSKRKSDFSKTITLPSSKELDKLFNHIFEINTVTNSFNANKRLEVEYYADEQLQIKGFLKLNEVITNDLNEVKYSVNIFGQLSTLFSEIGEKELTDVQGLNDYDHAYTTGNIANSWDTSIIENGSPVAFAKGTGYLYPLIENGFDSALNEFSILSMFPSIYAKEYFDRIMTDAGYTYTSAFLNSALFKSLHIPFNRNAISLTSTQVEDRTFGADDAVQAITGIATNLVFPTEVDPNGLYDNTTGVFTAAEAGFYNFTTIIDVEAEFTPAGNAVDVFIAQYPRVEVAIYVDGVLVNSASMYLGDETVAIPTTTTYSTGTNVPYPSDAHNTIITTSTSNSAPTIVVLVKQDNKKTNPASNLKVTLTNQPLVAGATVEVKIKTLPVRYLFPFGALTSEKFWDATGAFYDGTINLNVTSGKFLNTVTNSSIYETGTIDMYSVVPKGIKQKDYMSSIFSMFYLQIEPSRNDEKHLIIEPYEDFYLDGGVDWSGKRDVSKDLVQEPMGLLEAAEYRYSYKSDKDKYNQSYEGEFEEIYGQRSGLIDNDFVKEITKTDLIFSPTPSVGQSDIDMVLPTIRKDDDTYKATDSNIRILYYGGLKTSQTAWELNDTFGNTYSYTSYPYSGHFDDPFNPTLDINFGLPKRLYYDNTFNPITLTNNNLFNKYHLPALKQIANRDSKLISGYFYLKPSDIQNLSFRLTYYFDNTYFRLYKIENYDPNKPITKCYFIKLINVNPFTSSTAVANGGDDAIAVGFDDGVGTGEDLPGLSYDKSGNGNVTGSKSNTIEGYNNRVASSALFIDIKGDGNNVAENTRKIQIINGNNNIISSGLENVTLINSDGITVTESNKTYIGGKEVEAVTDFHNGFYNIEADETFTIEQNKQMVNFNKLTLKGTLNINGQMIFK